MTQIALPLGDLQQIPRRRRQSIDEQWAEFSAANPWIVPALVQMARDEMRDGSERIGIGYLVEVLRWHHRRSTHGGAWKVNNSFRSRMVRDVIAAAPDVAGLFELRELKTP